MDQKFTMRKWSRGVFVLACISFNAWITPATAQVDVTSSGGTPIASYSNLSTAFTAINSGTHTGSISIGISASFTDVASAVLNSSGAGSASYTDINIHPTVDGVTISFATATGRGVIELNGADNVTIDGDNPNTAGTNRNLTITNTAANTVTASGVIRLATATTVITSADNVTIRNLILNGNATGMNNTSATSTTGSENVSFGIFAGGSASTASATTAPVALGSVIGTVGSGATMANLLIENNVITNTARAISLNGSANTVFPNAIIQNNHIGNPVLGSTDGVYSGGILVNGTTSAIVRGNTIYVESYIASSTNTGAAINIGVLSANTTGVMISNNIVGRNINNNSESWPAYGINLNGGNNHVVQNNFIYNVRGSQVSGTGAFSTTFGSFGIRIASGTGHKIYYNTVSFTGLIPGITNNLLTSCLAITGTGLTGIDVRNNIFSNKFTSGVTTYNSVTSCLWLPTGATATMNLTLNNNAYYTTSATNSGILQIGTTGSAANTYLATNFNPAATTPANNMRAYTNNLAGTGNNDNASFASSATPPFVSTADLHINNLAVNAPDVDGKAAAIASVTADIDGDTRNATTPDIGADEFDLPLCAGAVGGTAVSSATSVCSGGSFNLSVTGATVGSGISYQWEISSTGGGTGFSNVTGGTGANTLTYTPAIMPVGVYYYRLNVTCATGPVTDYSNEVMVTVHALPTVGVTPPASNICMPGGSATLNATGANTYTWSPANGLSATTGTSIIANPSITTTYAITGTDVNNCVNTANVTVTVNDAPFDLLVTPSTVSICATASTVLDASAKIMGPVTAVLGTGTSTTVLNTTTAANFPNPFANFYGGNKHQMLIQASELTALGMVSGSIITSIGLPVSTVNVSGVGLLSFLVRAGHTSLSSLATFQTGLTDVTAAATYTPGPGVNTITFSTPFVWNGNDNIIIETSYSNNNGGTTGGNVNMVYSSTPFASTIVYRADNISGATMNNYTDPPSFTPLNSRPNITFNFTAPVPFPGAIFEWTPATGLSATTGASVTANPSSSTVYSVTALNGACSSAAVTATVNVGDPLVCGTITIPTGTICSGTNFNLSSDATGSGTLTYAWSDGSATVYPNAPTITANLAAGTYTFSLTVSDGCGDNCTTSVMVTIDPTPTASISGVSSSACVGADLNFTGNTDVGNSFNWTGPDAFASTLQNPSILDATIAATGTYTFTSTLGSCTSEPASLVLTVNSVPASITANASSAAVCEGVSFDLSTPVPTSSIILDENFNTTPIGWTTTNLSTGGTPANAAWTLRSSPYSIWSSTMSSNDASMFFLTNSDAQGSGSTANTLLQTPAFSTVGYTSLTLSFYHFYRDIGDAGDNGNIEISLDGTSWTSVQTYTSTQGAANAFVNATVNLDAYIGNPTVFIRFHYTATWDWGWAIDNVVVSGTPPVYTYAWSSTPAGFISTDQNPTGVTATITTDYTVTVTNSSGCSASATTTVTVNPLPTVTASSDDADNTVCEGSNITLNGDGADSYVWDGGVTDGVAFAVTSAATYTVTGTDINGCENTASITIDINALPTVTASSDDADNTVCEGSNITLNGDGADSYVWDGGVTDGVTFTPSMTDTYTVTGTDINGCENTASITININALPAVTANSDDADNTICGGSNITLNGDGADSYVWDGGVTDGVTFTPSMTDTYTVTGTDLNGCENTATITITVNNVDVTTTTSLSTITANSATGTYQWIDCATMTPIAGETNQSFTATADGDYAVMVTDNGCTETSACVNITGTGVQHHTNLSFGLYPNPTTGAFTIVSGTDAQVTILDMLGNVIKNSSLNKGNNQFNLDEAARGVYIVRITDNNGQLLNTQRINITK